MYKGEQMNMQCENGIKKQIPACHNFGLATGRKLRFEKLYRCFYAKVLWRE
jgi:hypothetical protein